LLTADRDLSHAGDLAEILHQYVFGEIIDRGQRQ
jgi:hypothetical protein